VRKVFKELATSGVSVTVVPVGSANNVARTLGLLEGSLDELVSRLDRGARQPFDLGEASAPWGTTRFVESFGGSLFAEVLLRGEEVDGHDDKVELGLRLLDGVLRELPALEWELEADGTDLSGAYLAVEAMNIRETGPIIPLAPAADPSDGFLDVVLVRQADRDPLLAYIQSRLRGGRPEPPELEVVRSRQLNTRPPAGCALRVDDELWPAEPPPHRPGAVLVTIGGLSVDVLIPAPRQLATSDAHPDL
jgi:diacylglycerol kinase (ATP)